MSKINEIQSKILQLDGGQFQKLVDAYIYKKFGYNYIVGFGSHTGTNKTTKGVPDTYFPLDNGKYVFVMYGSHSKSSFAKIKSDVQACLNVKKTGVEISNIQQIICCHTSSNISPKQDTELKELCKTHGVLLDIIGIDTISQDLLHKYQIIARNELGVIVDSGQVLSIDDFIKLYDENYMAAPIGIGIYGRDTEISDLLEKISNTKVTLVYGNSGVGKTRLIIEVCRNYMSIHKNLICYCIKNNGISLYEDLKAYIEVNKEYLIFVDDANQTTDLLHLIEYVNKENYRVKIIISVRDYAKETTENIVKGFVHPDVYLLKAMKDEQINEIMEKELNIVNSIFLDRINLIAKGNPRLAILAGRISKNNSLDSINNVEQLYENYYSKIIDEIDIFNRGTAIKLAGIISFFNTINLDDIEFKNSLLKTVGIYDDEFLDIVQKLHSMEIVDVFENSAVKISEQSMSNYLLYHVFAKLRIFKLSEMIRQYFPLYKQKIIYVINTIGNLFNSEEVSNYLRSEIGIIWDEFVKKNDTNFLEYMKMFHPVRELETLKYINEHIDQMDNVIYDISQLNFEQLKSNHYIHDEFLNILDGYKYSPNRRMALELIIKYYKKRLDMFMEFYFCLTDSYGVDKNSNYNDYEVQQDVIEVLILQANDFTEHHVNILLIRVASEYLKLLFQPAESKNDKTVVWHNVLVNYSEGSKLYRKKIWNALGEMFKRIEYQDLILQIIQNYKHREFDYDTDLVQFDLENIYSFINNNLDKKIFKHCYIVSKVIGLYSNTPDDINDYLNNKILQTYNMLVGKPDLEEYDYEKEQELKRESINNMVCNYSIKDISNIFDDFDSIRSNNDVAETWELDEGLTILFSNFASRVELYLDIIEMYIAKNTPLNANPHYIIPSLIKLIGDNRTYELIYKHEFNQKHRWINAYIDCLNGEQVNKTNLKRLNEFLFNDVTVKNGVIPYVDVLERFVILDEFIIIKFTRYLIEKIDTNPLLLKSFIRHAFHMKESCFSELLKYYSSDISVLKSAYFLSLKYDRNLDYNSWFLKNILIVDKNFLKEFIAFAIENKQINRRDLPSLSVIWQLDNWHQLSWDAMDGYLSLCDTTFWSIINYLEGLFGFRIFERIKANKKAINSEVENRQKVWIKEFIDRYCFDMDKMVMIFYVVCYFPCERRTEIIKYFINKNDSFEFFKKISIEPQAWSSSGSSIPVFEKRMEFIESILPMFNELRFLEHRNYLENKIEGYRKQIRYELKSEFMDEQ